MNQNTHRINDIIKQVPDLRYDSSIGLFETDRRALYNFAELIVRECVRCCEQVISDPVPQSVDTWLNGGEQCIQEIKHHFGLGMSVEDKKELIKDLLGVNNDTKS